MYCKIRNNKEQKIKIYSYIEQKAKQADDVYVCVCGGGGTINCELFSWIKDQICKHHHLTGEVDLYLNIQLPS